LRHTLLLFSILSLTPGVHSLRKALVDGARKEFVRHHQRNPQRIIDPRTPLKALGTSHTLQTEY
jgi:hypothetical protein